ncbi:uncharacterized protein PV06_09060 [Exophiala oligosperma]|uniref:Spindle pole body component n=1 Tax=Exophiala oligosperma TaxID=215243 RepID=A0A0D2DUK8_9EURO|nr:uncharacterized protein PV06_09060 [Exophiala oligosperma]KIW39274.1 hypothetical protein PV06_09060 [Exophiala oligosperma]
MLHEILLSLSGVRSPVWTQPGQSRQEEGGDMNQYVSPPEHEMLQTLARLHELHVQIKSATARVSRKHRSMVCRAVSSSIADFHLGKFVDTIVQVETSILNKDAGYVGAYDIVPLSTLVSEFAPWMRRMEWLSSLAKQLDPSDNKVLEKQSTAASILNFLERETHTGYSDIEEMAIGLLTVAHKAWMRAVSFWILYGKLPTSGADDFCIKKNSRPSSTMDTFLLDHSLAPKLLSPAGANVLLSIGSALDQLRSRVASAADTIKGSDDPAMSLLPLHMRQLESLQYPLTSSRLESVLFSINQSISENALVEILPRTKVLQLLKVTLDYLLVGHGEFAVSLIAHADARVMNRQQAQTSTRPIRRVGRVDDMAIKDAEINSVLVKAMAELAALRGDEDPDDDVFNFARKSLSLKPVDSVSQPLMVSTLLPTPAIMTMAMPSSSPLHIFLSAQDITTYGVLNANLLSIRRAGLHLSGLWKLTAQRRSFPTPLGPPRSATPAGRMLLAGRRVRDGNRMKRTRRHWTCASNALFLINELESYLEGEVIQSSWIQFQHWLAGDDRLGSASARSSRPTTASSTGQSRFTDASFGASYSDAKSPPSDPRVLAAAHRVYLQALKSALFLDDETFINVLKTLLGQIDHLVALFSRLQAVWDGLDLQEDDGVVDALTDYAHDEREVLAEMDRTSEAIKACIAGLIDKVREVEKEERSGTNTLLGGLSLADANASNFVPWQARTVNRLVMKLDSLAARRDDDKNGNDILDDYDDD